MPWKSKRAPEWVAQLSREQRETLARNLRALIECKQDLDRRLTGNARPRGA